MGELHFVMLTFMWVGGGGGSGGVRGGHATCCIICLSPLTPLLINLLPYLFVQSKPYYHPCTVVTHLLSYSPLDTTQVEAANHWMM